MSTTPRPTDGSISAAPQSTENPISPPAQSEPDGDSPTAVDAMDDVFALAAAAKHMARTEPDMKHAAVRKLDLNGLDLENQRLGHPLLVDGDDAADKGKEQAPRTRFAPLFITTCVFMGYAACVTLQHQLSEQYALKKGTSRYAQFQHAVSFNYIGNLIFRLAHNVIFSCVTPRRRVYISIGCVVSAMFMLGFIVCVAKSTSIAWVYLSYLVTGVGIGTYESNLISSITPLGHDTKSWAIVGMPLGFCIMSVGGQAALALNAPLSALYITVCALGVCSALAWAVFVPDVEMEGNSRNLSEFRANLALWREWLPKIGWQCLALCLDMWAVSFFTGISYWLYSGKKVAMLGTHNYSWLVDKHWFFVFFNALQLLGNGRALRIVYRLSKIYHPCLYLAVSAIGAGMLLSTVPLLGPIGIGLVFFANGAVYGSSTRHIDLHVDKKFNLIALSIWLFAGDVGSVIGSNSWQEVKPLLCTAATTTPYYCTTSG